jgi:hypothetical protein
MGTAFHLATLSSAKTKSSNANVAPDGYAEKRWSYGSF